MFILVLLERTDYCYLRDILKTYAELKALYDLTQL